MSISRRAVLVSLVGAGSDLGFRVDGTARDGAPIGALVVRVDGKWVAPQFQPVLRRAT
jgi:hypothetical protein